METVIFFFINFKIFIFFILLFIKIRVHTPVRLYTAFNMITVCNITVTYRPTALSKRRINTLCVTVFSNESNLTGYTYKHLSLINLYTGVTLCLWNTFYPKTQTRLLLLITHIQKYIPIHLSRSHLYMYPSQQKGPSTLPKIMINYVWSRTTFLKQTFNYKKNYTYPSQRFIDTVTSIWSIINKAKQKVTVCSIASEIG